MVDHFNFLVCFLQVCVSDSSESLTVSRNEAWQSRGCNLHYNLTMHRTWSRYNREKVCDRRTTYFVWQSRGCNLHYNLTMHHTWSRYNGEKVCDRRTTYFVHLARVTRVEEGAGQLRGFVGSSSSDPWRQLYPRAKGVGPGSTIPVVRSAVYLETYLCLYATWNCGVYVPSSLLSGTQRDQ